MLYNVYFIYINNDISKKNKENKKLSVTPKKIMNLSSKSYMNVCMQHELFLNTKLYCP